MNRLRQARPGSYLTALTVSFILIPIFATLVAATSIDFSHGPWGGGITLDWFAIAWWEIGPMITRSFLVALLVVVLNLTLGSLLARWMPTAPRWMSAAISTVVNLPLAVPGIAISIALVSTFPQLRPSGFLLLAGHLVYTLPFTISTLMPTFAQAELKDVESVAQTLGAGRWRIARDITLPWAKISLLQAATLAFALSFGEFNISFFVNPPATSMAPFALFDAYSTQRLEIASAQSIIFIAFTLPVLALVVRARRGSKRS